MIKYRYIEIVFVFAIITMAMFLYFDHFNEHPIKKKYYFMWIKLKELLFVLGITFLIPWSRYKLKIVGYILSIFYLIRVIWQIWELENYIAANEPYTIDILFGLLMLVILVIAVLPGKAYAYLKSKLTWRK